VVTPDLVLFGGGTLFVSIPQSGFLVVTLEDGPGRCGRALCFNPSVGILGGHTQAPHADRPTPLGVSIPQSGFLVVTPGNDNDQNGCFLGFNPSVGILGGHTIVASLVFAAMYQFQSLSRDSWWSHPMSAMATAIIALWFQSLSRDSWWSHLGRIILWMGILWFQSLSRDSWWSHFVWVYGHPADYVVSIPQSGFLVVTRGGRGRLRPWFLCFNPSVGILGGHTQSRYMEIDHIEVFQSLSRDSWWSHHED
jgi:hypothetical protein